MKHYLLFYDLADDYVERRGPFRDEHLRLAWEAQKRGEIVLAGALDDPPDGAVFVFQGPGREIAERFARSDPYVKNGLVQEWEVRPWTTVVGLGAATPVHPEE